MLEATLRLTSGTDCSLSGDNLFHVGPEMKWKDKERQRDVKDVYGMLRGTETLVQLLEQIQFQELD